MIQDDFESALHTFKNNRGRTVLSLSGIMVGIACVIAVTTLANSLEHNVKNIFSEMNTNLLVGFTSSRRDNSSFKVNDEYRNQLLREVKNLKSVYYANILNANVVSENTTLSWREIRAVDYGWMKAEGLRVAYGSEFTISDYANGTQKIIIGEQIAKWLFPEGNAVGKKIWLYIANEQAATREDAMIPKCFEVCGVLVSTETLYGQARYYFIIPRMAVKQLMASAQNIQIDFVPANQEVIRPVKEGIKRVTDQISGEADTIDIMSVEELIQQFLSSLKIITLIFGIIASLSLLVGGIGIMNIMIVTVTERKQEIGIRKAIGASKKNIAAQFLAEAITVTFSGAILGCGFGFCISALLLKLMNSLGQSSASDKLLLIPDVGGMLFAVAVSVFIGVFFGLYPALQAANLDPVIALEEE